MLFTQEPPGYPAANLWTAKGAGGKQTASSRQPTEKSPSFPL